MTEEANNEDLIAATIRRVAASKAARLPDAVPPDEPRAPELHLVQPEADAADAAESAPIERPPVDEDRITATLRRIEAEQAARADAASSEAIEESAGESIEQHEPAAVELFEPTPEPASEPRAAVDESLIEATLRRIEAQQAARAAEPAAAVTPLGAENDGDEPEGLAEGTPWEQVASELRRQLDETRSELRWLTSRVDALTSEANEGGNTPTPTPTPTRLVTNATPLGVADDEWDDSPQLPRIPLGVPPRPAIVRDPSPQTATAAQFEYDDGAQPAPRTDNTPPRSASAALKTSFELLPRTYRITVEDKRRGVDLVPLHRALLALEGVRDISLLSYSNGTAIVAVESTGELLPDELGAAVSHAMAREVKVEVHNEQTMVIKLAED